MPTISHKKTLKIKSKTGSPTSKTKSLTKTQRKRKARRIKLILKKNLNPLKKIDINKIFRKRN